nr:hypothetical protein [Comamonas testosteroni]
MLTNAFETENTKIGNEIFDILVDGNLVGSVSHEIRHFFEGGSLCIASGKLVIEHPSRQGFTDLAAFTEFSYTVARNTPSPWHLPVFDFRVPVTLQGLGIGRFVWHLIAHAIPESQRNQIRVHCANSQLQDSPRRHALFMDVCGKTSKISDAQVEANAFGFAGPLTDSWLEEKAKFKVQARVVCNLSSNMWREVEAA